ncbi:MAG: hypothetical protein LBR60_04390 [Fibrobacter sp.]|jgi:hypothetical protein|nr:hypothetical protein [Fibrobacter sp.]
MKSAKYFVFFFILASVTLLFNGCASYRKAKVAKALSKMELELSAIRLDSIVVNPALFEKIQSALSSPLPNPQIVLFVQNLSRGIINEELGNIYLKADFQIKNPNEDTLWIRGIQGSVRLDSLFTLPVRDSLVTAIAPGTQTISLHSLLKADQTLFSLSKVRKIEIKGELAVSRKPDGEPVRFDLNETKVVTEAEMNEWLNLARSSLLNGLIDEWAGAFLNLNGLGK